MFYHNFPVLFWWFTNCYLNRSCMYFQGQREYTFSGPKRKWCWYPYNITSFQLDMLCVI